MKKKSIKSRIIAFKKKLDNIRKKGTPAKGGQVKTAFQTMESHLKGTVDLQKEIRSLKKQLKEKKNELTKRVKKLKRDQDFIKKAKSAAVPPAPLPSINITAQPKKRGRKPKAVQPE